MKTSISVFYWLPRIICILAIIFISMFALDSFAPELSVWQQIDAFLMHLIPSFILIALLVIAWKWELIGGIVFTLIGLVLSPLVYQNNYTMNHSISMSLGIIAMITFPYVVVGILFMISYYKKRKNTTT